MKEFCNCSSILDTSSIEKIKQMAKEAIVGTQMNPPESSEGIINNWIALISDIIRERNLVTIYEPEEEELDSAIMRVLFSAISKENVVDRAIGEIKLAIAWNRIDIVESAIFHKETGTGELLTLEDYRYLMPFALEMERTQFVKAFLEKGLFLRDFLTVGQLILLYNNTVRPLPNL